MNIYYSHCQKLKTLLLYASSVIGKNHIKEQKKNLRAFLSCGDCFKNTELLAYNVEKSDEKSWLL